MAGKKFLPKLNHSYPPPPQKSHGQPHREWGKRRIWYLSKRHPSTKWLARVHHVVVFKAKVMYFKIENTPIKDTNGKRKFKRMLSFRFCGQTRAFHYEIVFRGIQPCFLHGGSERLPASFLKKIEVHSVYSMVKESTSVLKGNFCI